MPYDYIVLALICAAAFVLKAMTGFGPTIIVISFGSLFILPHDLVAMAAILDLTAGALLLKMEWDHRGHLFWIPLAVAIVLGSICGGLLVKFLSVKHFHLIMAMAIFLIGLQFIFSKSRTMMATLPEKSSQADRLFAFLGGFCGGLVGIDGPPLIWHFGSTFSKSALRKVLIPVFLAAAMARCITYWAAGLMTVQVFKYTAAALPGLLIGIYLGNKAFATLSETNFKRVVGLVLIGISLKHFF